MTETSQDPAVTAAANGTATAAAAKTATATAPKPPRPARPAEPAAPPADGAQAEEDDCGCDETGTQRGSRGLGMLLCGVGGALIYMGLDLIGVLRRKDDDG